MQEGNQMYEAGRWELLGRNASEGIKPRKFIQSGEPTVYSYWKAVYCLNERGKFSNAPRGLSPWHDNKGNCQELGRTRLFPMG